MIREDSREIVLGKKVNIFRKIKGKGKNFWGSEIKQGGPGFLKWIFLLIYFFVSSASSSMPSLDNSLISGTNVWL